MSQKPAYEDLKKRVQDLEEKCALLEQEKNILKDGSENFFTLAEEANDGIAILRPDGTYIYANKRAANGLGYSLEEFKEKNFRDLAHPDCRDEIAGKFRDRLMGVSVPANYETKFLHKDGSTVHLDVSGTRVMWDGKPAAMVIGRDISKRKNAERLLREREELLRATLESTSEGVAVVGQDQRVIKFNSLFKEMWRIPEKMLNSEDNARIRNFVIEQIEEPKEFLARVASFYGTREEAFDTLFLKDGRVFERGSKPLIIDGDLAGRVWNFRDITERRRAENALIDAERKFQDIVENAVEGVFQTTPEGQVIMVNQALVNVLGYDSSDDLIDSISDIGQQVYERPEDRLAVMKQVAKEGPVKGYETRLKRKDGSIIWVSMNFRRVCDESGSHVLNEGTMKDITIRKEMEEKLRKSEARYRKIFENTGTAMAVIDTSEMISNVNTEFENVTGYSRNQVEGKKKLGELSTPEGAEKIREQHCKRIRAGENNLPRNYESILINSQGDVRDVLLTVFPIPDSTNQIVSFIDITERRTAERKLQESEERYRSHFENVDDLIFTMDRNLQITSVSPSVKTMLGYGPEDFVGKDFTAVRELMIPDQYELSYRNAKKIIDGQLMKLTEYTLKARDGRQIIAEISGAPLLKDGEVTGTISVVRDVTSRKVVEKALGESEERYKQLVKYAPAGIYEVDYENEKFISVNDVMCQYTGYTWKELMAMKPFDIFAEESRQQLYERYEKLLAVEQVPDTAEYIIQKKNGEKMWVLINARYHYEERKLKEATGVVYDITRRKEAEKKMKESEDRLRTILESMPVMLVAFDERGDVVGWNEHCEKVTGYSRDEVIKPVSLWKLFYPDRKYRRWIFSRLAELGNHFFNLELDVLCKDGSKKIVSWSNISDQYPVPGWDSWGIGIDVTEIKEAHEILEEANVKLEKLIDKKTKELDEKAARLEELHSALKVLVSAREDYKRELEKSVMSNVKQLRKPHLDVLKKSQLNKDQMLYFGVLESHIDEIISPFSREMSSGNYNFTPQEIKVASLIRESITTKEIAKLLRISQSAVIFHRHNIRKKLGLIKKKVNLESYLQSFS
jgi:PAS domain S-box-containing protein